MRWLSLVTIWVSVFMLCIILASCAKVAGVVGGALGGGPNVAANVQAGRTNAQTVGQATFSDQRIDGTKARSIEQSVGDTRVRSERVETVIVQEDVPAWVWLLALLGWVLPTPQHMGAALFGMIARPFRGSFPGG